MTSCLSLRRQAQENHPPIAVITAPAALVGPGATVTLDGGESYDPDERDLTFEWTQQSGDLVVLDDPRAPSVSFLAPDRPQSLVFALRVHDGFQSSAAAQVLIRIATNSAPTATLAALPPLLAGATITLDASASTDPEAQPLSYAWSSPSHPTLQLAPVATPSFTVPIDAHATLTLRLTVSDGALSSTAEVSALIEPSDASAVFVDEATSCTADCDGTRAKPFKHVIQGFARARDEAKPILVASGFYEGFTIDAGVTIQGRCDPNDAWRCGSDESPSIIAGDDDDEWTVSLVNTTPTPVILRDLHILSSSGQLTPDGAPIGALRCQGCSMTVDRCYLEADGAGAKADGSDVVLVATSALPVRVVDSTLLMGRARMNNGVRVEGSTDVELYGLTIRSKDDVRNGAPSPLFYRNSLVYLHGDARVWLDRSRLEIDAGPEHRFAYGVDLEVNGNNATSPTFIATGNVFWFKGMAGAWGPSDGALGVADRRSKANVMIYYRTIDRATFVNNTFLGNAAAAAPAVNCLTNGADEACLGLSLLYGDDFGKFVFVNNYFQTLYRLVWNENSNRYVTFKNNSVHPDVPVLSDGKAIGPTGNVAVLGDGHLEASAYGAPDQLGEANVKEDCLLKDAANGDVHLLPGSPCKDTGTFDRDAPALDFDGDARPLGAAMDRGADEVAP